MGKAIYNPSGKAGEYSYWAVNFYNGCSSDCEYCYCKTGVLSSVWSKTPTLKKSLVDVDTAKEIFIKEAEKNLSDLQKHGLFFNFTSDPFLFKTIDLNLWAMNYCNTMKIPVKALTKQTWWIDKYKLPKNVSIGFTLTGHDELETGACRSKKRITAMKKLWDKGYTVWVSIEPVIDIQNSLRMIESIRDRCIHYKIGLLSGKKFDADELQWFIRAVHNRVPVNSTVYWKEELLKQAGIDRGELPIECVNRDYKWW